MLGVLRKDVAVAARELYSGSAILRGLPAWALFLEGGCAPSAGRGHGLCPRDLRVGSRTLHPAHICCCCNQLKLTHCNNLSLPTGSYRDVQLQVTVSDMYAYTPDSPLLHV